MTSMELSEFLRKQESFPLPPDNHAEYAKREEEHLFQTWIKKYPAEEHSEIEERLQYIRKYAIRYPDFDGEDWFPSQSALRFYDFRQERIKHCGLSEIEFYKFEILQNTIADLGLSPKATFDFIVYLWYELFQWLHYGKSERTEEKVNHIMKRIEEHPTDKIELTIKVGKKHFTFSNEYFIKSILANFLTSELDSADTVETLYPQKREIDYILLKTLLVNLPIIYKKKKTGEYTQAERTFGLCVLWLTGELNHKKNDSPSILCSQYNNATFDKLMRDYKNMIIPAITTAHIA